MNIHALINAGYMAADILGVLSKKNANAGNKIKKALSLGYPAATVLNYLVGSGKDSDESFMTREERTKAGVEKQKSDAKKNVALAALTVAGGAYGLSKLGQGAAAIAEGAITQLPNAGATPQMPPNVPTGMQPQQPQAPQAPPQPGPLSAQGIQQQVAQLQAHQGQQPPQITPQAPTGPPVPEIDFFQTTTHKNFPEVAQFVERHQQSGKTPEETLELAMKSPSISGKVKKFEVDSGVPFSEAIDQIYKNSTPDFGNEAPIIPEIEETSEPIVKGSKVITPDGSIGDVFHQKNDTSIIQEDGRRTKAKTEDLIPMPKAWEHLEIDLSKIPEQDRSSNLQQVAATEDGKQIVMNFWDKGDKPKTYIYERKDGEAFDPEILKTISEESDIAISSGMSFYGGWSTKDPSRGSAFHHRLKILSQAAGDPNDPAKPFTFKRAPVAFKHGYLVAMQQELNRAERDFNAEFKPPKKKKK